MNDFWKPALEVLQDLAAEPMAEVEELESLKRQIDIAIALIKCGATVPMSEQERTDHASRFGPGAFVVGDFVIARRANNDLSGGD